MQMPAPSFLYSASAPNQIHPMTTNLSRRIIVLTIPLFLAPPWAAAQPPPPIDNPYGNTMGITPAMAVIFASIVSTFLLMGCLSIYARRCVDYGSGAIHDGAINLSPSARSVDGLDPAVIGSFPTFRYSEVKGLKIGKGALECAVCLSEFEDEDTLRLLPKCCHVFHQACIDIWLYSNITCPVCRAVLVPRPGETNNFVLPVREPEASGMAEDDIIIEIQSPEPDDTSRTPKQSLPPRSTSRKNRFFGKFKRSFTTGHVVVRPGDDHERFTLRLPEEVRSRLVSRSMGRAKSSVVFPRATSKRNGYRSASVGATKGRSLLNYERFELEGWPDRLRFTRTPSVVSRTGSLHSPHWVCGRDCIAEQLASAPKKMSRSIKSSSFQRTACETSDCIKEDGDVGERPFDRLIFAGDQV